MPHSNGYWSGYASYRYGEAKKPTLPKLAFKPKAAEATVAKIMDGMADWRSSPFEFEGPTVAALRSELCLKGNPFDVSDHTARQVVCSALTRIGAVRPSWEEGQRRYSDSEYGCFWCGLTLGEGFKKWRRASRFAFCSATCATAFSLSTKANRGSTRSAAYQASLRAITRANTKARSCEWCASAFHPASERSEQRFCSPRCKEIAVGRMNYRTKPKECGECQNLFLPEYPSQRFCSVRCKTNHGHVPKFERNCLCCHREFIGKLPSALFCSTSCYSKHSQLRTGRWKPRKMTPIVFDFIVRQSMAA